MYLMIIIIVHIIQILGKFLKVLRKESILSEVCMLKKIWIRYLMQPYSWKTCAALTSETLFSLCIINYHYFRPCFGCRNVSSACRIWILSLHWWLQYDPWSAFRGSLDRYYSYITLALVGVRGAKKLQFIIISNA